VIAWAAGQLEEANARKAVREGGGGAYGAAVRKYDAEMKLYERAWEDLRRSREYQQAWDAVRAAERDDAIRDCIQQRVQRERAR
jgi:hypothetical protein